MSEDARPPRIALHLPRVGSGRGLVISGVVVFAVFLLSATSILFRPEGTAWSAWWPASGLAIGYAARFDRGRLWLVAAAMGAVSAAASAMNGREVPLAVWGGAAVAVEVWIGAAILRSRADRPARLDTGVDLIRLLVCAVVSSVTLGVLVGVVVAAVRGAGEFVPAMVAAIPSHAAGVLLITPLLIRRRREDAVAGVAETIGIWAALAGVVSISFGWNVGLPIAFLVSAPLTWGAVRLPPRSAFALMVVVSVAISGLSLAGRGPFAIGVVPAETSVLMVQLFVVSFAVVSLTVIILMSKGRRLASTVRESATLFRAMFDFSPVGSAIVTGTPTGPVVQEMNAAGRALLGVSAEAQIIVQDHLSETSMAVLAGAVAQEESAGPEGWRGVMTLRDARNLDVMISHLPGEGEGTLFFLRFFDVTDQLRSQRLAREDLARAADVQRSLFPKETSIFRGYDIAGVCVPARTVGGDFYDWYPIDGGLAMSLGDVMGKGVGAAMIAVTTRAALRTARRDSDAGAAVTRAADTMSADVGGLDSFTTLFHARLEAADGRLRYVDAGHGLSIILRADGTFHRLDATGLPLGIETDGSWTAHDEVLHPGDTLIAVSDGALDLYDGTLAALEHIAELGRHAGSSADLAATFADRARQKAEPDDDSTIVVIRRET